MEVETSDRGTTLRIRIHTTYHIARNDMDMVGWQQALGCVFFLLWHLFQCVIPYVQAQEFARKRRNHAKLPAIPKFNKSCGISPGETVGNESR